MNCKGVNNRFGEPPSDWGRQQYIKSKKIEKLLIIKIIKLITK